MHACDPISDKIWGYKVTHGDNYLRFFHCLIALLMFEYHMETKE